MNHGMVLDNIQERMTSPLVCRNLTSLKESKILNRFGPSDIKEMRKNIKNSHHILATIFIGLNLENH